MFLFLRYAWQTREVQPEHRKGEAGYILKNTRPLLTQTLWGILDGLGFQNLLMDSLHTICPKFD